MHVRFHSWSLGRVRNSTTTTNNSVNKLSFKLLWKKTIANIYKSWKRDFMLLECLNKKEILPNYVINIFSLQPKSQLRSRYENFRAYKRRRIFSSPQRGDQRCRYMPAAKKVEINPLSWGEGGDSVGLRKRFLILVVYSIVVYLGKSRAKPLTKKVLLPLLLLQRENSPRRVIKSPKRS